MMKSNLIFILLILLAINVFAQNNNDMIIQGHRGARGLYPENTIKGFLMVMDYGVNILEMDVVVSQDKKIVVSHDAYFNPDICLTPEGKAIKDKSHLLYKMNYKKIKKYDCGSLGNQKFPKQKPQKEYKPLLRKVITEANKYAKKNNLPTPIFNIEIKSKPQQYGIKQPHPEEFAQLVLDVIEETGMNKNVIIQSFDTNILNELNKQNKEIISSYLTYNRKSLKKNLRKLDFTPNYYSPYYKYLKDKDIKKAHKKGMKVVVWTVNTLEEIKAEFSRGVDEVITDYPNFNLQLRK